jgi:hypothetical protein
MISLKSIRMYVQSSSLAWAKFKTVTKQNICEKGEFVKTVTHNFKAKAVLMLSIVLFIGLFVVDSGSSTFPSDKPTLYIDPPYFQAEELGDLFQINITIYNVTNLYRYALRLDFNPALIKCLDVELGGFFESGYPVQPPVINNTAGFVALHYTLTGADTVSGSGALNVLIFNATYATPLFNVTSELAPRDTFLLNRNLEAIPHYVQYGEYESPWIPDSLSLTVTTDKERYNLSQPVSIYGNLTAGTKTPKDGIVAIEVLTPEGDTLFIRTRPTSTNTTWKGDVEITQMISCNKYGEPKYVFDRGDNAYFKVTIINNDLQSHTALVTVSTFDSNMAPIEFTTASVNLPATSTSYSVIPVFIDEDAPVGESSAYACVLTGRPKNQGTPYCPERSALFEISGGDGGGGASIGFTANGQSYNVSFQLRFGMEGGVYSILVSTRYRALKAFNNTLFEVEKPGDVNGDGFVNIYDLTIVGSAWDSRPGDDNWDERADINNDDWVYLPDLAIVGTYYDS